MLMGPALKVLPESPTRNSHAIAVNKVIFQEVREDLCGA